MELRRLKATQGPRVGLDGCVKTRKGYVYTNVGRVALIFPSVGLTLTWFIWDRYLAGV